MTDTSVERVIAGLTQPEAPRGLSLRWIGDAVSNPPAEPPVLIEGMLRAGELCVVAGLADSASPFSQRTSPCSLAAARDSSPAPFASPDLSAS